MILQVTGTLIWLIIIYILIFVFFLIFLTIFLKIGLAFVESENTEFGSVFATALICTIVMWLLIVLFNWFSKLFLWLVIAIIIGLILCWIIIAKRHEIGFGAAIVVTIIAVIAAVIIIILIILAIGFLIGFTLWVF